jgi:hypothetical protein
MLEAFLFVILINDLTNEITNKSVLYANDSKVYCSIESNEDRESLENDIDAISRFLNSISFWT